MKKMNKTLFKMLPLVCLTVAGCASSPRLKEDPQLNQWVHQSMKGVDKKEGNALEKEPEQETINRLKLTVALPEANKEEAKRFNLVVKKIKAGAVYQIIAENAGLNLILDPNMNPEDLVTLQLKNVSAQEALVSLREAYGWEFEVNEKRMLISRPKLTTRFFKLDYLALKREGNSQTKVTGNGIAESGHSNGTNGNNGAAGKNEKTYGSEVETKSQYEVHRFLKNLQEIATELLSDNPDQKINVVPETGLVYVKAMPAKIREIESFLNKTKEILSRQVMLEVKIVEVTLAEGSQGGINWSTFDPKGNHRYSMGANTGVLYPQGGGFVAPTPMSGSNGLLNSQNVLPLSLPNSAGMMLAFTGTNFSSLMSFLDSQGSTQVLSAPRVMALNNQKALLKVGTDDFFVTNISSTSATNGSTTTNTPSINLQPFFSGIALDVTPSITEKGTILLHVHPTVSDVVEKTKNVNLGSLGAYTLPLASSTINDSDTVVHLLNGDIVAIGGLMSSRLNKSQQKVPGLGDVPAAGELFKQHTDTFKKTELVILIKPTLMNKSSALD